MFPSFDAFGQDHARVGDTGPCHRRAGVRPPALPPHGRPRHSFVWHATAPHPAERPTAVCPDPCGADAPAIVRGSLDRLSLFGAS